MSEAGFALGTVEIVGHNSAGSSRIHERPEERCRED